MHFKSLLNPKICLLLLFALLGGKLYAQEKLQNIHFRCLIQDSANHLPIEDASVFIFDTPSGRVLKSFISDNKGLCEGILTVLSNQINIEIYASGFSKQSIQRTIDSSAIITIDKVFLRSNIKILKSVTIVKDIPPVKFNGSNIEFNINSVPNSGNMSMLDILDYLPFITIDEDKKSAKFMGETLTILINNKPHPFYNNSSNLNTLPPQAIENIEVRFIPTARNGNNKVMNITLKKNYFLGWRGNLNLLGGRYSKALQSSASYWKNKFGVDFAVNLSSGNSPSQGYWENKNFNSNSIITQNIFSRAKNFSSSIFGSMFYNLDSLQTIDLQLTFSPSENRMVRKSDIFIDQDNSRVFQHGGYQSKNFASGFSGGLNYTRKFRRPKSEFYLLTQFSQTPERTQIKSNIYSSLINEMVSEFTSRQYSKNKELSVEAIIVNPVKSKMLDITSGCKYILRNSVTNFSFLSKEHTDSADLSTETALKYVQNIVSIYVDGDFKINKSLSAHAGIRGEATRSTLTKSEKLTQAPFNVLPNLSLTYMINQNAVITTSFTRETRRPDFGYSLTAFQQYKNAYYSDSGNADLSPQYSNVLNVQFYSSIKSVQYGLGLNYTNIRNFIDDFFLTKDSSSITKTFTNSNFQSVTLSLNLDFTFAKKFRFSHFSSGSIVNNQGQGYRNNQYSYYLEDKLYYNLSQKQRLAVSLNAFAPNITLQGKDQSMNYWNTKFSYSYFFNLSKSCPSALGFSLSNPWRRNLSGYVRQVGPGFEFFSNSKQSNPYFALQLTVNFKGKEHVPRNFDRAKSIQNNDLIKGK